MINVSHCIDYLLNLAKCKGCNLDILIKTKEQHVFTGNTVGGTGVRYRDHCDVFLRLNKGGYEGVSHARSLNRSCLNYCFEQALAGLRYRKVGYRDRIRMHSLQTEPCIFSPPESTTSDKILEIFDFVSSHGKSASILSFGMHLTVSQGYVLYAATDDTMCVDQYAYHSLFFDIALSNRLRIRDGFLEQELAAYNLEPKVKRLYHRLSRLSKSRSLPSGVYDVVLNPDQMAFLFSCYHRMWSARWAMQGLNPLRNGMDKKLFDKKLTIFDRPSLSNGIAKIRFDDEGSCTSDRLLVSEGRLVSLLHNTDTAQYFSVDTTSNAFWNYMMPLDVKPHRLCIETSISNRASILAGSYIVVLGFIGLEPSVNVLLGDFKCRAYGFFMKDNTYQYAFHGAYLSGNFYNMINQIAGVSETTSWDCCRQGRFPTIRFNNLTIS